MINGEKVKLKLVLDEVEVPNEEIARALIDRGDDLEVKQYVYVGDWSYTVRAEGHWERA